MYLINIVLQWKIGYSKNKMCLWNMNAPAIFSKTVTLIFDRYICEIRKLYHLPLKSYDQCKSFLGPTKMTLKSDLDLDWWPWTCNKQKGLVTMNSHVKYEGPISYHSKVMSNVKVPRYVYDLENWPWPSLKTLNLVPTERSCHKEYSSKDMANVKVLFLEWGWPWKLTLTLLMTFNLLP